jgi:transcriptional regulator with XRE-family HTH domain
MYSDGRKTLIKRLRRGKKVREQFVSSHLSKGIAFQIRATRDRLGWNQDRLAKEVGMTQNAISRLESPEYGKPTITTLKRLAAALDIGIVVHFVPFSQMIDWTSGTRRVDPGLSTESLAVPNFSAEEEAGVFDSNPERIWTVRSSDIGEFSTLSIKTGAQSFESLESPSVAETTWTTPPARLPFGRALISTGTKYPIELGQHHG